MTEARCVSWAETRRRGLVRCDPKDGKRVAESGPPHPAEVVAACGAVPVRPCRIAAAVADSVDPSEPKRSCRDDRRRSAPWERRKCSPCGGLMDKCGGNEWVMVQVIAP